MDKLFKSLDNNFIEYNENIIGVIIDNKDNIWFNAKQVASALGYVDTKDALKRHVDKTDTKQRRNIDFDMKISGHPYNLYINEAGLYSIILSSKLKSAKKFKVYGSKRRLFIDC